MLNLLQGNIVGTSLVGVGVNEYLKIQRHFLNNLFPSSLDPLDDSQIDQLMKEDSLKRTADDIFRLAKDQAASTPVGDSKEKA